MKVLVVGLGLIGGAYAYRLSNKGHEVYGCDTNINSINYARDNNYIVDGSVDAMDFIPIVDIIVLSIYPQAILSFLKDNNKYFKPSQIITDVCGVKSSFIKEAERLAYPAVYCSHHPMAGREKIGIEYSKECIFEGANFLITPSDSTPANAVDVIKGLGVDLGFFRISLMDYERHDEMIGFTSQLTHAIAVSLVNSDHDSDTKNFIGDSYRDLTRIAMINENLWSELFLENKDYLVKHINSFELELSRLKDALISNDKGALKELFISSTKIRKEMEK
ncbi:MAG: prephenate dehydrogenase [Erysipelotrichaceae bacterium]|nr:prephenate dehydrogenase [Erysipelotrichaceae bacterium]